MKIKTSSLAISLAAFLIAAAAAAALIGTTALVDRANQRSRVATQLMQVSLQKTLTRTDYQLNHEPGVAEQWFELNSRAQVLLSRALELYKDPELSAKLKDLSDDTALAGEDFTRIQVNWELHRRGEIDEATFRNTEEELVAGLSSKLQDLADTANSMGRVSEREVDAAHDSQILSLGILIGVLALFVLVSTLVTNRRVIKQLSVFRKDVRAFSWGDLDHRVAIRSKNEIGELAVEFNSMAARLQDTHNSLEKEIDEKQSAKDEVERLNEDLERRAAQLEVYNEELESFAYSVAHDLRAPLRAIDGFSRILQEEQSEHLDIDARSSLARIRSAAVRMAALIDDILELSRITRSEMWSESINLSSLAEEVGENLKIEQPARYVSLIVAPDMVVTGDPAMMRIVVVNLLGNAWKFTSRRADARIEFGRRDIEGNRTYFVKDNGEGFDMAYADKLFNPFQRLHSESQFPGTGIGLATVKRILRRHGGTIWAESRPGEGATFYFTL